MFQRARYPPARQILSSAGEDEYPICRTQGDAREVALYKALGTIRNLKFLDLELNVSDPSLYQENASIDPDWDDFDNQYTEEGLEGINRSRNGHIRNLLVNTLIDEPLASSIFEADRHYPPRCEFSRPVRFFASEWTIERDLCYEHRDKFEARISQNSIFQSCYKVDVYPWVAKVFLQIWPITQDGNNTNLRYWDVWKSFPLAVDETQ
ncbi:hypothetical protein IFM47457_05171 [Aspergillus lentulus]|nr:hypothetical protein IFM47457_05171 [Aspergillus lentulus]